MVRDLVALAPFVLLASCDAGIKEPDCYADTGGWTGDSRYSFYEESFACDNGDGTPIDTAFAINTGSFVSKAGLVAGNVNFNFDNAKTAWNAIGANVSIARSATPSSTTINRDDGNFAVFLSSGPSLVRDDELAHSSQWSTSSGATDCDIELWTQYTTGDDPATSTVEAARTVNISWSTSSPPAAGSYHLESVLVHELGHCLGFDHNNIDESVMKPGLAVGAERGTPSAVDELALLFLYGPS